MEFPAVSTQPLGITEMIAVMAPNQQVYSVPAVSAYPAVETYTQYPQYVAQVAHPAYIAATAAAPQAPPPPSFHQHIIAEQTVAAAAVEPPKDDRYRDGDRREYRDRDRAYRDKDRERDRKDRDRRDRKERDHRDRKNRDKDRRSRSRERDWYRDDERESSYEGSYDDDYPRHQDYRTSAPNNTIMIRGLAKHITENDIRTDIYSYKLMPKDIRLVRKKECGTSRGFAFVEFTTVDDATSWMEEKQGVLVLHDVYRATLQYSITKESDQVHVVSQDWFCVKCSARNFKRRDTCFKCNASRAESESTEEICHYPTNMVILQGLDTLSTEEKVLEAIQHAGSNLPIRSVRVGRDPLTNTSRGVCYIELNSVLDSMQLFNKLAADPPVVDGKLASLSYCKLHTGGQNSNKNADSSQQQPMEYTAGADIKKLAEYSASLYAKTAEEHAAYVQYYMQYYQQQQAEQTASSTQADSTNAAAAVAQTALKAMQKKGKSSSSATGQESTAAAGATVSALPQVAEYPKYPTPDVSTYSYDQTSGYYYDSSTGLYYDANSSYYYNAENGTYLYWDSTRSTYIPVSSADDGSTVAPTQAGMESQDGGAYVDQAAKDKREKLDKVKVAKKIAKDMAKWAKALNKRTENAQKGVTGLVPPPQQPIDPPLSLNPASLDNRPKPGSADMAFSILLDRKQDRSLAGANSGSPFDANNPLNNVHSVPSVLMGAKSGLVAAYGGGDGSDSEEDHDSTNGQNLVDYEKMACLLCKRQFPSNEALNKHVQLSSLHKSNMEALKGPSQRAADKGANEGQTYRDRAKERRIKYHLPKHAPPSPSRQNDTFKPKRNSHNYEAPYSAPAPPVENIGSKLLKQMGWTDGQGLGKSNQGRTTIIEAEMRAPSAGLGVQGANYAQAGDSYKDCVKKMMMQRYQEVESREKNGNSS